MMKKRTALTLFLALFLVLLTACSTAPAETTAPPDTEPVATEPTVPPTTEPVVEEPKIPEDYVCLNDLIKGTGITIKTAGPKILLIEDGLTIVLSEARREAYRDQYIVGVMKGNPILENGKLYIQKDFFRSFFCKEGTDRISMFYTIKFYQEEAMGALRSPDRSEFTRRVCEEICLPQSLDIPLPHLDTSRIFLDAPLSMLQQGKQEKLLLWGFTGEYVSSEYDLIADSQTLKTMGISDDDSTTLGEYNRRKAAEKHEKFLNETLTEEQRAFLAEKDIDPGDYEFLLGWFAGSVTSATDKELLEATDEDLRIALLYCYRDTLGMLGTTFFMEFLPEGFEPDIGQGYHE